MRVLNDHVLVEDVTEQEGTSSLIFIPPYFKKKNDKVVKGKIVALDTKARPNIKPGSYCLYGSSAGFETTHEGKKIRVLHFSNLLAANQG